jgi:hypothetical protein
LLAGRAAVAFVFAALVVFFAREPEALAGRRPFLWVYDTEVLAERGAEIEQWVTQRIMPTPADATDVWWGAVVGVTDNVELALPLQWTQWQKSDATKLEWYGADLRIRLASADKMEAGPIVPLVRLGIQHQIRTPHGFRIEGDAVVSWDASDRLHLTLDVGGWAQQDFSDVGMTWAAGASHVIKGDFRLGAEVFGESYIKQPKTAHWDWFNMVGPQAAWTHGRLWVTFGMLFNTGDEGPKLMPRLIWAFSL